jgi:hypothetical protein
MNSSKTAFIATVIVALLAVAAAIFAFWMIAREAEDERIPPGPDYANYKPSEALQIEMEGAAERLIRNNYTIIKLYVTQGLPFERGAYPTDDNPFGVPPEDGIYYVISDEYTSLAQIEAIIDETFTSEEARRVKENLLDDDSPYYSEFGRIFHDKNDKLGINLDFAQSLPNTDYPVSWVNPSYVIIPQSATECAIAIRLHVNDEEYLFNRIMYKFNGEWYFEKLIFLPED